MKTNEADRDLATESTFISTDALLKHWQGHRLLTRRMIEAFPEDKLFSYSVGGMRPFAELAMEMIKMGAPGVRGIVSLEWPTWREMETQYPNPKNREELLALWDKASDEINEYWPQIPASRFLEVHTIFQQWKGTMYWAVLYFIDNEIHHRGQGYVYLRALGIEPPAFWDRP